MNEQINVKLSQEDLNKLFSDLKDYVISQKEFGDVVGDDCFFNLLASDDRLFYHVVSSLLEHETFRIKSMTHHTLKALGQPYNRLLADAYEESK